MYAVESIFNSQMNATYSIEISKLLMTFCFFFQLEDDIIAKKTYFTKITDFVHNITSKNWFYIEFSILGFIGKQYIYF